MTPTVVCAQGALAELPKVLALRDCRHVFLVTGRTSYRSSGAEYALKEYLEPYTVTRFSDVEENPKLEKLELGLARFAQARPDLIVAVGGGSVMDMAKLLKIFSGQPKQHLRYLEGTDTLSPSPLPLVAIPTTAGSGSQATHFAVLYVGKSKKSVAHPSMLPDAALVDPDLLKSVPPPVAASTGLDALNQAIESYWSIHSTDESKALARESIEVIPRNLPDLLRRPSDDSRLAIAKAAHRAGEAINITKTTAPHAISYPITSYFGVPHGQAVALVLARVLLYNAAVTDLDCLDTRGAAYVRATLVEIAELLGEDDAVGAARAYDALVDEIGLCRDFKAVGIKNRKDLETIIANGFNPERVNNNPRRVTASSLRDMLIELQDRSPTDH